MEQRLPDNKQINNLPQGIYIFQIINNEKIAGHNNKIIVLTAKAVSCN
jgi:hypothetical protein